MINRNRPGDREAAIRLSGLRGKLGGERQRGDINQRTCVHAYKPNQWSWTTWGVHTWEGVWDGNGGMRTIMYTIIKKEILKNFKKFKNKRNLPANK